jgi:glycosyltransferase involved in cell wall biosynthesis
VEQVRSGILRPVSGPSAPLVSILMPAFNAERWIADSLDSALAQTWPRTEIIVVDDGSTDGTAAVVGRYADRGVRLIRQANAGQSAAENACLRAAQGDFIQYLDADDILGPDKIERQMARIADAPACVASGEWGRFDRAPEETVFRPERVWRDMDPIRWLVEAWTGGGPMMQAGIWLIPRRVAERAGMWDERLGLINDLDYFTRVLLASDGVRFCKGARLYYRSGNIGSLASMRSPAAWRSALLSSELATRALLARENTAESRRASADIFQVLAFDAYLEDPAVCRSAERAAVELGGSPLRMDGGRLFRGLERALGWKAAKRIKRNAYRVGYSRLAAFKTARLGRSE